MLHRPGIELHASQGAARRRGRGRRGRGHLPGRANLLRTYSPPSHTDGGALYARYQLSPKFAIAGRSEYLSDRGALYSGVTQAVKETTFTFEQKVYSGFLVREEWRRDFSNHPYFLTDTLGILKKDQSTATLGLVWWFGAKEGPR